LFYTLCFAGITPKNTPQKIAGANIVGHITQLWPWQSPSRDIAVFLRLG
jgi:hypothetical protein